MISYLKLNVTMGQPLTWTKLFANLWLPLISQDIRRQLKKKNEEQWLSCASLDLIFIQHLNSKQQYTLCCFILFLCEYFLVLSSLGFLIFSKLISNKF